MSTRAIIYARVSSGRETDDTCKSIPDQIADCKALAENMGFEVVAVVDDKNRSGRAWPSGQEEAEKDYFTNEYLKSKTIREKYRDGLAEVVKLIETNKATVIIVRDKQRVYRPVTNSRLAQWIPEFIVKNRVTLYTCDGEVIKPENTTNQWLLPTIDNMVQSDELTRRKQNSIKKRRKMRDDGKWIYSTPWGYIREKKGVYSIDEKKAVIIKRIFREYLSGKKIAAICRNLNNDKIKSPGGTIWVQQLLMQLLDRKVYCGKMNDSKGHTIECINVPAIIDEKTFLESQRMRDVNRTKSVYADKKYEYLLTGFIHCGCCGKRMQPNFANMKNGKKHFYYECMYGKVSNTKRQCQKSRIVQETINDVITPFCAGGFVQEILHLEQNKCKKNELSKLQDELDTLLQKESELLDDVLEYDKQQFKRLSTQLANKINNLQNKINDIKLLPDAVDNFDMPPVYRAAVITSGFPTNKTKWYISQIIDKVVSCNDKIEIVFLSGEVITVPVEHYGMEKFLPVVEVSALEDIAVKPIIKIHDGSNKVTEFEFMVVMQTERRWYDIAIKSKRISPLYPHVMERIGTEPTATAEIIKEITEETGYKRTTVRAYILKLAKDGILTNIAPGIYKRDNPLK